MVQLSSNERKWKLSIILGGPCGTQPLPMWAFTHSRWRFPSSHGSHSPSLPKESPGDWWMAPHSPAQSQTLRWNKVAVVERSTMLFLVSRTPVYHKIKGSLCLCQNINLKIAKRPHRSLPVGSTPCFLILNLFHQMAL